MPRPQTTQWALQSGSLGLARLHELLGLVEELLHLVRPRVRAPCPRLECRGCFFKVCYGSKIETEIYFTARNVVCGPSCELLCRVKELLCKV